MCRTALKFIYLFGQFFFFGGGGAAVGAEKEALLERKLIKREEGVG